MDTPRKNDRMSSMPLLDMNARDTDSPSGNEHLSWSDQEFEDVSQDPLEGVLRSVLQRPRAITRQQCVLSAVFVSALSIALGFCAAYFIFFVLYPPKCTTPALVSLSNSHDKDITKWILQEVNPNSIKEYLRNLTNKPHIAGSQENLQLAEYIQTLWNANGLTNVKLVPYDVVLSYPNKQEPNNIEVVDHHDGRVVLRITAEENPAKRLTSTFNAYAHSGHITGTPVYVNFGRIEDFEMIRSLHIDLMGKIVIARYGNSFRANIVKLAEQYNASGVILFSDPHEYAPQGRKNVYPKSVYLPGNGTQVGTVMMGNGDPSTPGYPSVEGAFHIPEADLPLPKIPVQPIGYDDAEKLLGLMDGHEAPVEWRGALNVSYVIGPGFANTNLKLHLNINNANTRRKIYNVIGTIPGKEEPDRYVLLGNHRDAWTYGAIDPNSATALLIEITRVFGKLLKTGWKPRRTMIFCSWDAEEYGLIGSTEWVEENVKNLAERAVAYLNIDLAMDGNFSLHSAASPSLFDIIYESAKKIPNPNPSEISLGRTTVYDTWLFVSNSTVQPKINLMGDGSDHAAFIFYAGVPSFDFYYTSNKKWYPAGYPLYHSLYETFDVVDQLYDPGFKYHVALAQLWGETARALTDSVLLPLSMVSYAKQIEIGLEEFENLHGALLKNLNINLEYFRLAVKNFSQAAKDFHSTLAEKKIASPLELRIVNDQMMQVERAFIQPEGLPQKPGYRHVIISPSNSDAYSGCYFPSLIHSIYTIKSNDTSTIQALRQQLATVTYYINSATLVLGSLQQDSTVI